MLIIIGVLLLILCYVTYNFSFAYCVHHIDESKTKSLYSFFLNKLNSNSENEDDFTKLMVAWVILMGSFGLNVIGIMCLWLGIIKIL